MATNNNNGKSLESWIWDAACSIRGAKDAPKYKEFILPLIFAKRLCDVFDDELDRIAKEVGSRPKAFKLVKHDKKLVRFFLPLEPKNADDPVWSVILPTYQEQREIAEAIGAVDAKIHHHRRKKTKLEDIFRTLLHQLMTAQIRVNDLDLDEIPQQPVTEIGGETVNPPIVGNGRDRSLHEGSANK